MLVRQIAAIIPLHFHSTICRLGLLMKYMSAGVSSAELRTALQVDSEQRRLDSVLPLIVGSPGPFSPEGLMLMSRALRDGLMTGSE